MKAKAKVVTLGCYKNLVDSERLMRQLQLNDIELIAENQTAEYFDIVAINTCGFIHDAKEESIETILYYVNLKDRGVVGKIVVFGCLSERYKNELIKEIPEVDNFFGKFAIDDIVKSIDKSTISEKLYQRTITTPSHYAYLKISEGCNRKCAFCAIPLITGKHKSVEIEDLVKEARFLAEQGTKELILVAQDLNQYGSDFTRKATLYELIDNLSDIPEIEWIRLQYLYPQGFPKKLPKLMANNPKICHYVDIPFQHVNNVILQKMERHHSYEDNIRIVEMLREAVPDIAIRTTLIVGFPSETDKRFDELMKFIETVRFERLGAFAYSHEENTPAAKKLKDNISEKVKLQRLEQIMSVQEKISTEINQSKIGTIQRVIVDRKENNIFIGRTQYDSPEVDNEVFITNSNYTKIKVGDFINVEIVDAHAFDLFANTI